MNRAKRSYHEKLLHWIWQNLHFDYQNLQTSSGQVVNIHHTGTYNKSDGPDFKKAEVTINGIRWFGDIEIHWKYEDWRAHGHQADPNFENVVLHVVFDETEKTVRRKDQSIIPTLSLSPYLAKPLHAFLTHYVSQPQLPCSGHISFISEKAFKRQLEKAHQEYFEQKVDDLLEFYDPGLPPSRAWKQMFVTALFDGLGISHNRKAMQTLSRLLLARVPKTTSAEELRQKALALSEIKASKSNQFSWNYKGCRPGNHPLPRILQAADCLWFIQHLPFEQWLRENPKTIWKNMRKSISVRPSLGTERSNILFGTVFLPALYTLGNLFFSEKLKSTSISLWHAHHVSLPPSLIKLFSNSDLPPALYNSTLGTVFQLRAYCRPKQCQNCEVFKSVISS